MPDGEPHIVAGAFGYSGGFIARRLLEAGRAVRTLTNSPHRRHELAGRIEARPLAFDDREHLIASLRGGAVLYNTYWVRFNHRSFTFDQAVANTLALFDAAREAGVRRVVHVSITNPSEDSPFAYFRGKAKLERALIESGLSHAILRPAVLFGGADILINNIAWALRRLPIIGVFGDGEYRLQPIHVDDFAALAIAQGERRENAVIDAIGPETFTYRRLIESIGRIIGRRRPIVSIPPRAGHAFARALGGVLRDVMLTREEIGALMAGLLCTDSPPAGPTRLSEWAAAHADELGRRYASEMARRRDRTRSYLPPG
jgi:uncharacterized protein YbjT (DUF2867 family)